MFLKRILAVIVSASLLMARLPIVVSAQTGAGQPMPPPVGRQTPDQLQQLVAPIALYPDELVAEVLAAATYPTQIVEADRWLQDHKGIQGQQLANEVDKLSWDSSVKALTEFPTVLANMDKNLSWTSSLGDAYVNQQQDVMNAVQMMRQRAENTGSLTSNSKQNVQKQGNTIVIEPATPDVVYVPTYDHGPYTELRSWRGPAGTRIRDSTLQPPVFSSVLDLVLASSGVWGGVGITGDVTGAIAQSLSTTLRSCLIARRLLTGATSIMGVRDLLEVPTGLRHTAQFEERTMERLADSITAA